MIGFTGPYSELVFRRCLYPGRRVIENWLTILIKTIFV
jgi:hypothetical protein